jgi:hypothetical protein
MSILSTENAEIWDGEKYLAGFLVYYMDVCTYFSFHSTLPYPPTIVMRKITDTSPKLA